MKINHPSFLSGESKALSELWVITHHTLVNKQKKEAPQTKGPQTLPSNDIT
jgi:hypothetical protein